LTKTNKLILNMISAPSSKASRFTKVKSLTGKEVLPMKKMIHRAWTHLHLAYHVLLLVSTLVILCTKPVTTQLVELTS
jgi:hypothetical protein